MQEDQGGGFPLKEISLTEGIVLARLCPQRAAGVSRVLRSPSAIIFPR